MHLLCVHPGKEDVCTELFTYAIRKLIFRLEVVMIFRAFREGDFDEINRR